EVVVRVAGDTTVEGRAGALQRAVSNLVENAAKFDRGGTGAIEVVVARGSAGALGELGGLGELGDHGEVGGLAGPGEPGDDSDVVRVEVLDRGPGVPDCDLERIFDRFYRAPDARSLPGSGLGLSIVRAVASAHGGAPFAFRREGGGLVTGFTVRGVTGGRDG
ncbi:sensor histidine kinase, partial [Streptomyces caniscabiei]